MENNTILLDICKKFNVEFFESWTGSIYLTKRDKCNVKDYVEIRISDHNSINDCLYDIQRFKPNNLRADKICLKIGLILLGYTVKGKIANRIVSDYQKDIDNTTNQIYIFNYKYNK